jgi:hypothetical protein
MRLTEVPPPGGISPRKNTAADEERMTGIQTPFEYSERAAEQRLVARERSQPGHSKRSIGMIGAEQLLLDCE